MFRNIMAFVLFASLLSACSDSLVQPIMEEVEENFAFSAKMERTGYLVGALAHHEVNFAPAPSDFLWPSFSSYSPIGEWELDDSPAHTLVVQMGFASPTPGETFTLEYRIEWVNGETSRPFTFSHTVVTLMENYTHNADKGAVGVISSHEVSSSLQQIDRNRYRAEFTIPTIPTDGSRLLYVLPGLTLQCNAEGIKSFIVSDITYAGAGFAPWKHEGSVLFTGACQRPLVPLPRYSRVAG